MGKFMESLMVAVEAANQTIEKSSSEYKEKEKKRRQSMTDYERCEEDLCKFRRRLRTL